MRLAARGRLLSTIEGAYSMPPCVPLAVALCGTICLALFFPFSSPSQQPLRQPDQVITTADLQADLFFLASDDLAGRSAGTLEDHIATDFIAAEFMRLGLKPVGDNGTYFQNISLVYADLDREHTTLTGTIGGVAHTYTLNQDFRWTRQSDRPEKVCGEVVFAGYGIDAPEFNYNDFAGIDPKGKIALVFNREPQANDPSSRFMGQWDTYHAFNFGKIEVLRKQGLAGILEIQDSTPHAKPIPASSPRATGGPDIALAGEMWDIPIFTVKREVADQFLASMGKTADGLQAQIDRTGEPDSFDVPGSSACMTKAFTNIQTHPGRNVVGLLEGSDPQLKEQTIIVSAHHDHMGTINGRIYHGADDDGSGTAGVMEIAKAFVEGGVHPRRSVLFIAYDAEERGLVGSYYYTTHPIVPLNDTVADFNMDMIGRNENEPNWPTPPDGNINMVNVLGTRYNPQLSQIIDRANQQVGLKLDHKMDVVDPDSLWSRADEYWWAPLHIPQVLFQTGLQPDYHTDNDTWQTINYPKMTKIVRLIFLSVADLANSGQKVAFLPTGGR
jgi:hypothetical protein